MNPNYKKIVDKIRVLITGPNLSNFSGGQQTHVLNVLDAFKNNERIVVHNFVNTEALQNKEGLQKKILRNFLFAVPFLRYARNYNFIHLNSTFDDKSVFREMLYALIGSILLKKKLIWQFHGGDPFDVRIFNFYIFNKLLLFLFRRVRFILILSNPQLIHFNKLFPNLQNTKRVVNYIDPYKDYKENIRKFDDTLGKIKFLFLGRLHKSKGIVELINASIKLRKYYTDFELIVCGDGPLKNWLINRIKKDKLDNFIRYSGVVTGKAKTAILNECHVFILPTKHKEGVPYAILESFKHCMPVISCDEGAIIEIVIDDKNGYIVDPQDINEICYKMYLLCDKRRLKRMSIHARRTVEEKLSFQKMIKIFENLYR